MTNESDAVLVQQSQAGDKAAFSLLVTRYLPRVRRVLLAMLRHPAEVDDILQEAFLQAYLSLDTLRDSTRFRAWVCGIAINLARMWLRSLPGGVVSWEMLAQMETAVSDHQPTPEELAERRQVAAKLAQAVADLPPAERDALLLVYQDGLSHRETAVALGASLNAVKVRVHRGRRRLRDKLLPDWAPQEKVTKQVKPTGTLQKETIMISVKILDVLAKRDTIDTIAVLQPILEVMPEEHHAKIIRNTTLSVYNAFRMHELVQTLPEEEREAAQKAITPLIPHRIVLLREQAGDRMLPIWIGPFEADAIALKLRGVRMERPITHDLLTTFLELGQIKVQQAAVSRIHDKIFYGSLWATIGDASESVEIDCRVSDALSLAVRLDVPIVVAPAVMDESSEPAAGFVRDEAGNYVLDHVRIKKAHWRSMLVE